MKSAVEPCRATAGIFKQKVRCSMKLNQCNKLSLGLLWGICIELLFSNSSQLLLYRVTSRWNCILINSKYRGFVFSVSCFGIMKLLLKSRKNRKVARPSRSWHIISIPQSGKSIARSFVISIPTGRLTVIFTNDLRSLLRKGHDGLY